jgi:hypothetical protein
MVVDNLDVFGVTEPPDETYPILIVHPNAVLSGAIAGQRFKPVPRRRPQIIERFRGIQVTKLAAPNAKEIRRKALR